MCALIHIWNSQGSKRSIHNWFAVTWACLCTSKQKIIRKTHSWHDIFECKIAPSFSNYTFTQLHVITFQKPSCSWSKNGITANKKEIRVRKKMLRWDVGHIKMHLHEIVLAQFEVVMIVVFMIFILLIFLLMFHVWRGEDWFIR